VPFGLKRRVPIGLAVLDDEQRREPAARAVPLDEGAVVGLDRGVRVDDEEDARAGREERLGVLQAAGRAEEPGLSEEEELREFRRAIDQVLLDLVAEMVEIDRCLADTEVSETREVREGERNVEVGEERLGDPLRHGPEPDPSARGEEEGPGNAVAA